MKSPATTTQMEAGSGNAVQRMASHTSSLNRTASQEVQEEVETGYNPPTYSNAPASPQLNEKPEPQRPIPQAAERASSAAPETQAFLNETFPHHRHGDSDEPLEEPRCDLLPNRPAIWLIKAKGLKISSLAASILMNDGILTPKDLTLLHTAFHSVPIDQGPTDPISGILTATHRTIVGVLGGVADYPVAISHIATKDSATSKRQAASFALDSGKGVSRILGTGLKAPMEYTMGISQGFHNVPKLWGDKTVRDAEPVTGVSSGFKAGAKGFGLGLYDGITGLVTQPVKGAKEGGVGGFVGGFFKGIGGVACKPAAGVAGLPAYAFKGFYEEYQKKRGMNVKTYTTAALMQQGWEELGSCTIEERNEVLGRWYQVQSSAGQVGYKIRTM